MVTRKTKVKKVKKSVVPENSSGAIYKEKIDAGIKAVKKRVENITPCADTVFDGEVTQEDIKEWEGIKERINAESEEPVVPSIPGGAYLIDSALADEKTVDELQKDGCEVHVMHSDAEPKLDSCIDVDYFGRYGNQLFQYFYGVILSMKHNMRLAVLPPVGFLLWDINKAQIPGIYQNTNQIQIGDEDKDVLDGYSIKETTERGIHLHGYFQDVAAFNPHRDTIKGMIKLPPAQKNTDDIVIHLRLADYWSRRVQSVLHPDYYLSALRREKWNKVYVVVDAHETNEVYLKHLRSAIPANKLEIISGAPEHDFHFIRSFDKIVCSNSTFAWWAAFLSDAKKIYTPSGWCFGLNLAHMVGATVLKSKSIRNKTLEAYDWRGKYWKA